MSKNKGMSRGGRLLALLAVLAVLCGGYFVVTNMTQKEAVIETGGSFEVAGLTPDEITSMAWQNGDETIRLVRADGVWSLDGEANFPLKQDVADELASDIAALEATHTVTGGADAAGEPADFLRKLAVQEFDGVLARDAHERKAFDAKERRRIRKGIHD